MSGARYTISRYFYGIAGIIFLGQSLFGCVAVLGVGFDTLQDVLLDLSLTMAFPIFLIALWSRRIALLFLGIFFIAQWIDLCAGVGPPKLISPLSDWHDISLFLAVILFTIAVVCHGRTKSKGLANL
jgi:hypothetical protein